mgnify:CR=1 FL=1
MKNEKISVVIPMYNTAAYIEECLLSVQCQTYEHFECLIVDDGSADSSAEIVSAFASQDARFRLIRQEHAGVSGAICNGIQKASGQWLYFLDSDDWIDAEELEHLYLLLDDHQCDMVASNYVIEAGHSEVCSIVRFNGLVEKKDYSRLFYHQLLCNERYSGIVCGNTRGGKLVRKSIAQENMYLQEGMVFAEDAILMLGILCDCERVYADLNHAGYHYRKHHNSSMHTYGFAYAAHRAAYAQKLRELFAKKNLAGNALVEQNYSRFELYNILGSLNSIGFDMRALEHSDPETYKWMQQTIETLSHLDMKTLGKRNVLLLWMLKHEMFSVLTVLYGVNRFLRYTLKLSK